MIVKAGKKFTGINDYIWIGKAVIDACKLSSQGNSDGFGTIVVDRVVYGNIKDKTNKNHHINCLTGKYSNKLKEYAYHCDCIYNDLLD